MIYFVFWAIITFRFRSQTPKKFICRSLCVPGKSKIVETPKPWRTYFVLGGGTFLRMWWASEKKSAKMLSQCVRLPFETS